MGAPCWESAKAGSWHIGVCLWAPHLWKPSNKPHKSTCGRKDSRMPQCAQDPSCFAFTRPCKHCTVIGPSQRIVAPTCSEIISGPACAPYPLLREPWPTYPSQASGSGEEAPLKVVLHSHGPWKWRFEEGSSTKRVLRFGTQLLRACEVSS